MAKKDRSETRQKKLQSSCKIFPAHSHIVIQDVERNYQNHQSRNKALVFKQLCDNSEGIRERAKEFQLGESFTRVRLSLAYTVCTFARSTAKGEEANYLHDHVHDAQTGLF